jgi:hypothetical protein
MAWGAGSWVMLRSGCDRFVDVSLRRVGGAGPRGGGGRLTRPSDAEMAADMEALGMARCSTAASSSGSDLRWPGRWRA